MILGIDAGNYEVKVCEGALYKFPSLIGEARELKLANIPSRFDFEYEYKGEKGFAGTLAQRESVLAYSKLGSSKAHDHALIRILLACSSYDTELQIVVGQPISSHNSEEKQRIKDMLIGNHEIKVNNKIKNISITNVEVAAETASAYLSNPILERVHVIDMGAGTINVATIENGQYIDKDSFTIEQGAENLKNINLKTICNNIFLRSGFNTNENIWLVGGMAEALLEPMKEFFNHVEVMYPLGQNPTYANVIGYYRLGRMKWKIK